MRSMMTPMRSTNHFGLTIEVVHLLQVFLEWWPKQNVQGVVWDLFVLIQG